MNKKKLLTLVLSLVLIGAVGVGATLAYFTDTDNVTNTITMGKVEIEITEPSFSPNAENNTLKDVMPGQVIAKDPTIKVVDGSAPAYIRVKITDASNNVLAGDNEILGCLDIDIEKWTRSGDYYYYVGTDAEVNIETDDLKGRAGVVSPGKSVVVFDEITIPTDWNNTKALTSYDIKVVAEAIQADNFLPDDLTKNENGEISGTITGWTLPEGHEIEEYTGQ